jgi:hypothetical protein
MPPRKTKSEAASGAADYSAADAALSNGIDEAAAAFKHASTDEIRFSESVALMRAFSLIDDDAERQQVIALARQLAERD